MKIIFQLHQVKLKCFLLAPAVCGTDKDDCHPTFSKCTDTSPGLYTCVCIDGYEGDGKECKGLSVYFSHLRLETVLINMFYEFGSSKGVRRLKLRSV